TASAVSVPTDSIFVARSSDVTSRSSPALSSRRRQPALRPFMRSAVSLFNDTGRATVRGATMRDVSWTVNAISSTYREEAQLLCMALWVNRVSLKSNANDRVLKWKTGMNRRCKSATARFNPYFQYFTSRRALRVEPLAPAARRQVGPAVGRQLAD